MIPVVVAPPAPGWLRRLRGLMAEGGSAEERLHQIVRAIANEMVAEVCSIYLLRAGEVLELFATQGLNPAAVHRTRLRVGEGLVGDIAGHARPLALDDAQSHPQFRLPPGNRRGDLSLAGRRADRARRSRARRAGRAEPHPPPVRRGRDRDAADHRHGAGGADRGRSLRQSQRDAAGRRPRPAAAARRRRAAHAGRRHRPRRAARAAHRHPEGGGRGYRPGAGALRGRARTACARTSTACSRRTTCSRASSARSSRPSACSSTIAAGSSACAKRSARASPPRRACSAPSTTCARGSASRPIPTSASG